MNRTPPKASVRDRDRELIRLSGARLIIEALHATWWGRLALRWAMRRLEAAR
jgi:hypothetical protein